MTTAEPEKAHHNNFGALRLILASAVIVSHSPQMLEGSDLNEPLVALGSHFTIGGLAVDGFFIISGYLIASSFLANRSLAAFLTSRVLRIYPAFIVAYLICVFAVGPIGGGALDALGVRGGLLTFARMFLLMPPDIPGAFHTLPIPALNGSMWTIRYEFRCYLLVGLLGVLGLLDRRALILSIAAMFYAVAIYILLAGIPTIAPGLTHQLIFGVMGDPERVFMLGAVFMSGVCFRLYRGRLPFRPIPLLLCALVCGISVMATPFGDVATGLFGTYLLLWMATGLKSKVLLRINNSYDYSYGTYLYAWPIASLIILIALQSGGSLSPFKLTVATVILSVIAGAISWYLIERPMQGLKPRRRAN